MKADIKVLMGEADKWAVKADITGSAKSGHVEKYE